MKSRAEIDAGFASAAADRMRPARKFEYLQIEGMKAAELHSLVAQGWKLFLISNQGRFRSLYHFRRPKS